MVAVLAAVDVAAVGTVDNFAADIAEDGAGGRACVVELAAAAAAGELPLSRPGNSSPSELHAGHKNDRRTSLAGEGRWRCCGL